MSDGVGLLANSIGNVIRICGDHRADEMANARAEFDARRGPVFEDEDLWETRSRAFLEWFVIENQVGGSTAIARAIEEEGDDRVRSALVAWSRSYRVLAEFAELDTDRVLLIDLIGGAHLPVDERRGLAGVAAGDIAECRVVAFEGEIHFGGWFLWHPEGTRGALLSHIEAMRESGASRIEMLDFAASLRVRSLRYSHVPPARVYTQASAPNSALAARV